MKPHPKIRKTVKWGGAAVTLLLVVVWIGSVAANLTWCSPVTTELTLYKGRLQFRHTVVGGPDPDREWWAGFWAGRSPLWTPQILSVPGRLAVTLPLWIPTGAVLLVTASAWRLDMLARRRERAGLCPKCYYDRAGLAAGAACPECGSAAP
jgi:hypothetical protein